MPRFKVIIERVWSKNVFLPRASILMHMDKATKRFYHDLPTNSFNKYCYRLRLRIIKLS